MNQIVKLEARLADETVSRHEKIGIRLRLRKLKARLNLL